MEDDFKLIAPHVNRLLSCYEGFQNPEQPGAELMKALDPLFKAMADLAPYEKNDEAKGIWIIVPRGDISDWGDFESEKEDGEVDSYEEFEQIWLDYYPNETEWYYVGISENKPDSNWKFRGLSVASRNRHHLVINAELREGTREETWYKEEPAIILCKLILPAVEHSMELLRKGLYNKMVEESLPYPHRTGVIPRKVEWEYYPEAKANIFEGLSTNTFLAFKSFIKENDKEHIGRMKTMTANDFFKACAAGYLALLLPLWFGLDGVLYSMPVSDLLTFVIAAFVITATYRQLSEPVSQRTSEESPIAPVSGNALTDRIITIGRNYGAGGRTIAQKIARKLNIR